MTVAFAADASDYKDYKDVTYNEAVDVMTAIGVFNGTGDGTNFSPDGTLALGEPALDTDLEDLSLSDDLTREQAAQMAFNAMKADIVEYDSQTSIDIEGRQVNIGNTRAQTVTTSRDWGGNLGDAADSNGYYTVQFAEQYCRDLSKVTSTDSDAFGRPAVEWRYDNSSVGTYADTADYSSRNENLRITNPTPLHIQARPANMKSSLSLLPRL